MVKYDRSVVLVSGGLDSATCLALARQDSQGCFALSFDYGQRSRSELDAARAVVAAQGVEQHRIIELNLGQLGGSALTDVDIAVPDAASGQEERSEAIPVTYVPARNTVFLAYALAWAEVLHAQAIFIGVNALDYSGYPDCRPEFIEAFQRLMGLATKAGVEGAAIRLETPLIHLSKRQIIGKGIELGVDYSKTVSCYQADAEGNACGRCDSCYLRRQGFEQAQVQDPTRYA